MKMKVGKIVSALALSGAIAFAVVPKPASATIGFPGIGALALIPDICAFGTCIQFTHAQLLLQMEQYLALVQNFQTMKSGSLTGEVQSVTSMVNQVNAVSSQIAGTTMAIGVMKNQATQQGRITALDSLAGNASGEAQNAQVQDGYLSLMAGEQNETNDELAAAQEQHQSEIASEANGWATMFASAAPTNAGL